MITIKAKDKPVCWYCKGEGRLHSGKIEPGQVVSLNELKEYYSGTESDIAAKLEKYKAELPEVAPDSFCTTKEGVKYKTNLTEEDEKNFFKS